MTDLEFGRLLIDIQRLDFVDNVNAPTGTGMVLIEVSPTLRAILPQALQVLQVERSALSVNEVIRLYQVYIVEYLEEVTQTAQIMLRAAKKQTAKLK
ncbi:hypothetical protein [Spirosoma endophyticum]|uniref:Uncharacterized protein n=1 Tax=Spirosoma endophyticum TaxID=662367 RepID=A0A1I2DG49_9BACT|nr:hypothetical protein [Spirosoma endophyticum]SFE79585.1 hypothetical protein SAMN05216167_119122 [Spirosoma endophyticum]